MSALKHFQYLSVYNNRMNRQIFTSALTLPPEILLADKGAFFKSINGTLNHLLVGDLIWFGRFVNHSANYNALKKITQIAQPKELDEILFHDTQALFETRKTVDSLIIQWTHEELTHEDLDNPLTYKNMKGQAGKKNFRYLLAHVFNHQTHHRGQVSTLLAQCGIDIGVTDFLIDLPNIEDASLSSS